MFCTRCAAVLQWWCAILRQIGELEGKPALFSSASLPVLRSCHITSCLLRPHAMPCEWWRVNKQTVLAQVRGRPAPGLRSLGRPASRRRAQARSHGLGLKIGHQLLLLQRADDHGTQPPPHPLILLVLSPFDLAVVVPCLGPGQEGVLGGVWGCGVAGGGPASLGPKAQEDRTGTGSG